MPNWCYNQLWVSVPQPRLKEGQKKLTAKQKSEVVKAEEELQRFKQLATEKDIADETTKKEYPSDLSLQKIVPIPKPLLMNDGPHNDVEWGKRTAEQRKEIEKWEEERKKSNIEKYGFSTWYDYRIAHWGTKWDVEATLEQDDVDLLEYQFDSAWAPPIDWMDKASKLFPRLKFQMKYEEPGMCFMGSASAKDGVYKDECIDYTD